MPIRWTSENDQLLLVTILDTHEINLDFQKIAQAWRAKDDAETPTPRAIKERIFRIRQILKTAGVNGALNMSGNSTTATPKFAKSAASTPKTPVSSKRKRAPAATAAAVSKKKKKNDGNEEGSESDVMDIDTPSKKPANTTAAAAAAVGSTLKVANGGSGGSGAVVKEEEKDGPEKDYGNTTTDPSGPGFVLEDFVNMGRMADITDFTAVKSEEEV